ncbi:MAG: hypothetical protein Q9188_007411, partial [Gyalolechia gomerana]
MEVPVEDTAPRDDPGRPAPMFEIRNENFQAQSINLSLHERLILSNWQTNKNHGRDIRRINSERTIERAAFLADIADINTRRICNVEEIDHLENAASIAEVEQQALSDQHGTFEKDVWDHVDELGALASSTYNTLETLTGTMEGVQTQASDTQNEVGRLKELGRQLKKEMQKTARETRDIIRGLQEQLEPPDLAADRLATELSRLCIDSDTPVPGNDSITTDTLVPRNTEPAVQDATNGRIDELERTFQNYYRRLQARTARVERLGQANRTGSNDIIRACNIHFVQYMARMQVIDAIHTTIRTVLRSQNARILAAERTSRTHREETDQAQRETNGRLQDQSTRLEEFGDTLAGVSSSQVVDNAQLRRHSTDIRDLDRTLGQVRLNQENHGARLDDYSARLDATNTQLGGHPTSIRSTLDNHRSRLSATDTQLAGHSSTVQRIEGTLNGIQSNHESHGARLDTNDTQLGGLSASIQGIDGTLNGLSSRQATQSDRVDATARLVNLLKREHVRMSRYIRNRVSDAMEGTVETGMSRAMENMNAEIQRLGAEVE